MKRSFLAVTLVAFFTIIVSACSVFSSLTSTTSISPENSFLLGNNEHGKFSVTLKNTSKKILTVVHKPIAGGSHSPQQVQPNETVYVEVEKNTALEIKNPSKDTVQVQLKVKGDTGLSMGYSNQ